MSPTSMTKSVAKSVATYLDKYMLAHVSPWKKQTHQEEEKKRREKSLKKERKLIYRTSYTSIVHKNVQMTITKCEESINADFGSTRDYDEIAVKSFFFHKKVVYTSHKAYKTYYY